HQVTVEWYLTDPLQRLHDRKPQRQVRHEVGVHHVNVHPIGALVPLPGHGIDLRAESSEVSGQDTWCDEWSMGHRSSLDQPCLPSTQSCTTHPRPTRLRGWPTRLRGWLTRFRVDGGEPHRTSRR